MSQIIDRISCCVMVGCLIPMVVVVFAQVVFRYAFQSSIFWSEELSRYLMIWGIMFAAGVCLRRGVHMGIRVIHDQFPQKIGQAISLAVYGLILGFLISVLWFGLKLVTSVMYQTSPTLGLPMGIVYLAIPIGAALMIIHTLALLSKIWRLGTVDDRVSPEAHADLR